MSTYKTTEPTPSAIVPILVNCGDYLSLLSRAHGHNFVSPLHRVVLGSGHRTSCVFFWYPGYEARIPGIVEGDKLSLWEDQSAGSATEVGHREMGAGKGNIEGRMNLSQVPFGEFIRRKWSQVYR
ncbi:hypothetical protein HDU93_002252 [Gonapodya sp. JEL0774]|nr:hypothetical protein HDU93_002252 [Gonapodya sp. JEL0774]